MAPKKAPAEERPETPAVEDEPPPPPPPTEDEVTELETGLQLPLRGVDVGEIWALDGDFIAQTKVLEAMLGLAEKHPVAPRRQAVCEFYLYNLSQAKALCLSTRQGAVFHAIMDQILNSMRCDDASARAQPKDLPCGPEQCFQAFQQLLLQHSVASPPDRLDIFKVSEARMLADFAMSTLFKHFLLYQFCLSCPQEVRPMVPLDVSAARLRPRRKSQEDQRGAVAAKNAATEEEDAPTEDEVSRLVEEKLRETEATLQAKLEARETAFHEQLAAKKASMGKK